MAPNSSSPKKMFQCDLSKMSKKMQHRKLNRNLAMMPLQQSHHPCHHGSSLTPHGWSNSPLMKTFFTIFLGFIGGIIGSFICFVLMAVAFEPVITFFESLF